MKIAKLLAVLFLLNLLSFQAVWAQTPSSSTVAQDEQVVKILQRLEEKNREVKTIIGTFEQLKVSKLFLEEIHSRGTFYFEKPGKFRCDYFPPNESVNLIIGDTAWLYVPEIKQVDKYRFAEEGSKMQRLNQMLLGFGVSPADVLEVYRVTYNEPGKNARTFSLVFVPKKQEEKLNFTSITIWFDAERFLPQKIKMDDESGDETTITIEKIETNKKIDQSLFKPEFPEGVEIIEQTQ
jgi:outer membrane lipoprotein carrier protein